VARKAREKDAFGVYYIQQTSAGPKALFENDDERSYFLEILKKAQQQFAFKLYGYCLLSRNSYHLVLDVSGGDLSSIMKSINIRYAMYKKCTYPLFKDRYKSRSLLTLEEIHKKIDKVNKESSSHFNSFCHYNESAPVNLDWIAPLDNPDITREAANKGHPEDSKQQNCIKSLTEAQKYLVILAKEGKTTTSELLKDRTCRNQIIKDLRKGSALTLKEIGAVVGGLSESSISKILNE